LKRDEWLQPMSIRTTEVAIAMLILSGASADAEHPTQEALEMISWVARSNDNQGLPFIVIDKVGAEVFVFDRTGAFMGATPALIGSAKGDHEVLGVGDRELSNIKPSERTTPAGRFVARLGPSLGLGRVLWIDIPGAVAMHPVITNHPREHRLQRLQSATPADNRITYGCVNISPTFYNHVVEPIFNGTRGVVYILPETRPLASTFPGYRSL